MSVSEYRFGAHELTIKDGQFRSLLTRPSPGAQGPSVIAAVLFAAPQLLDSTATTRLFPPSITQVVTPQTVPRFVSAAPQTHDLTLQASLFDPIAMPSGIVPRFIGISPQLDIAQQASVYRSIAEASPTVKLGAFYAVPPQTEDRPTQAIYAAVKAGQRAPVFGLVSTGQQLLGLTRQSAIFATASRQIVLGQTVRQFTVLPQPDLNVSYSMIWTQSTFSPSGPVVTTTVHTRGFLVNIGTLMGIR